MSLPGCAANGEEKAPDKVGHTFEAEVSGFSSLIGGFGKLELENSMNLRISQGSNVLRMEAGGLLAMSGVGV